MTATDTLPHPTLDDLMFGDGPGARREDPIASHVAAEIAATTKAVVRERVLLLVRQEVTINGRDLNKLYQQRAQREGWGEYSYESPRKRAEEMLRDNILSASNEDGTIPGGRIYSVAS